MYLRTAVLADWRVHQTANAANRNVYVTLYPHYPVQKLMIIARNCWHVQMILQCTQIPQGSSVGSWKGCIRITIIYTLTPTSDNDDDNEDDDDEANRRPEQRHGRNARLPRYLHLNWRCRSSVLYGIVFQTGDFPNWTASFSPVAFTATRVASLRNAAFYPWQFRYISVASPRGLFGNLNEFSDDVL